MCDKQVERPRRPSGELVTQPLAERAIRIEAHDVAQVAVHVLVVLGPRELPGTAPGRDAIDVLDDALDGFVGFRVLGRGREGLDLLKERGEVVRVAQQNFVQLPQGIGRCVEERLAAVDGTEPVGRQQCRDLRLHFLLLSIEPALSALDARDEVAHGHPQGADDILAPGFFAVGFLSGSQHFCELRAERAREQSEALTSEGLISEEVLDDRRSEPRQRVLAGAHDAGPVDASEHTLFAKPLDRVRRALAGIIRARLDHIADLLEHVDEHVLLEGRQRRLVGPQVEPREKAQIDCLQVEVDLVARKRRDDET
ncbi:MAG TPA: hypothetical protein VGA44_01435 [Steroidobacteraceae bacterium]